MVFSHPLVEGLYMSVNELLPRDDWSSILCLLLTLRMHTQQGADECELQLKSSKINISGFDICCHNLNVNVSPLQHVWLLDSARAKGKSVSKNEPRVL